MNVRSCGVKLKGEHGITRRPCKVEVAREGVDLLHPETKARILDAWTHLCKSRGTVVLSDDFFAEVKEFCKWEYLLWCNDADQISAFAIAERKRVECYAPPDWKVKYHTGTWWYKPPDKHSYVKWTDELQDRMDKQWARLVMHGTERLGYTTLYVHLICGQQGYTFNIMQALDVLARKLSMSTISLRAGNASLVKVYKAYGFAVNAGPSNMPEASRAKLLNELNISETGQNTHLGKFMTRQVPPWSLPDNYTKEMEAHAKSRL